MDNYSKVLTFFMENGVQLNPEQLEALKEEFLLQEKSAYDKALSIYKDKSKNIDKNIEMVKNVNLPKEQKKKLIDKYNNQKSEIAKKLGFNGPSVESSSDTNYHSKEVPRNNQPGTYMVYDAPRVNDDNSNDSKRRNRQQWNFVNSKDISTGRIKDEQEKQNRWNKQ